MPHYLPLGAMPTQNLPEYAVLNEIHNYAVARGENGTQMIKIESCELYYVIITLLCSHLCLIIYNTTISL